LNDSVTHFQINVVLQADNDIIYEVREILILKRGLKRSSRIYDEIARCDYAINLVSGAEALAGQIRSFHAVVVR